jgi:hypothetical protein
MNSPPGKEEERLITKTQLQEELDFSGQSPILSCPRCNHFIKGSDVNIEKTIAKCSHCEHVFAFEHDSNSLQLKPVPIIPEGIETLKLKSELDIRLKWLNTTSKGGRKFLTLFAAMWNLMLLPFVLVVILSGEFGILLFLSLHLLVGLGLLWHLGTIYLNRTSILINKRKLRVRTIPLRHLLWPNTEIDVDSIQQLYVTKYVQSTSNGIPNYAYALYAILDNGEKRALIRGMSRETQIYIEKEIEDYLGIKKRRVPEEDKST